MDFLAELPVAALGNLPARRGRPGKAIPPPAGVWTRCFIPHTVNGIFHRFAHTKVGFLRLFGCENRVRFT